MSAIANFFLIDNSKLEDLKQNAEIIVKKSFLSKKVTDNYWDFLANNAIQLRSFNGSGYIYGNLLVYLQEDKGIDLLQNEYDDITKELIEKRGSSHFIMTRKQMTEYLERLNVNNFSLPELQKFNEEFSEEGDEETAQLSLDAIQVLRDNLSNVQNENQVLLLIVG